MDFESFRKAIADAMTPSPTPVTASPPPPDQFQYTGPASGSPYGLVAPLASPSAAQTGSANLGATANPGSLAPFQGYSGAPQYPVPTVEDILRAPPFNYSDVTLGQIHQKTQDDVELPSKIMDGASAAAGLFRQHKIQIPIDAANALYQSWAPQMTDQRYNDTLWKSLNDRLIQQSEGSNVPPALRGIL